MTQEPKLPAHWFILQHLEAFWNSTHPALFPLSEERNEYPGDFLGVGKAMDQAMRGVMPGIVAISVVNFLIVMLERITIPEDDLPSVVQKLKRIHSREPPKALGEEVKESLQSLIEHLSSYLPK